MDIQFQNYMNASKKAREEYQNQKFKEWLLSDNDRGIYNKDKINTIYLALLDTLQDNKYHIINENQFKDELASYIYRLSLRQCPSEV